MSPAAGGPEGESGSETCTGVVLEINDSDAITHILETAKTIAVVGLSSNPSRPSYSVASYMQSRGYRIVPVNPNETEVLGEKAYASLEDVPEKIDLVDIFRKSEEAATHVDEAIQIGAAAVWMQEGVVSRDAAARAQAAGLEVVMDRCILKEHIHYRPLNR